MKIGAKPTKQVGLHAKQQTHTVKKHKNTSEALWSSFNRTSKSDTGSESASKIDKSQHNQLPTIENRLIVNKKNSFM